MAEGLTEEKNKCECYYSTCKKDSNGDCDDPQCKDCKVCCTEGCLGCGKYCQKKGECKCRVFRCGCPTNCYGENGDDKECQNVDKCKRCKTRCSRLGNRCICANCDCGCSYGLCNCCPWCKRNYCTGNCDGYVIGRCKKGKCEGHYKYYGDDDSTLTKKNGGDVCPAVAKECKDGLCISKCTACGRLCVKHFCHCIGSILIIIAAIVSIIFIAWNKYPEKFRKVYYDLRGAFNTAPGNPGRSLNNLSGDRLPEDISIDRYSVFRPRAYAGLS